MVRGRVEKIFPKSERQTRAGAKKVKACNDSVIPSKEEPMASFEERDSSSSSSSIPQKHRSRDNTFYEQQSAADQKLIRKCDSLRARGMSALTININDMIYYDAFPLRNVPLPGEIDYSQVSIEIPKPHKEASGQLIGIDRSLAMDMDMKCLVRELKHWSNSSLTDESHVASSPSVLISLNLSDCFNHVNAHSRLPILMQALSSLRHLNLSNNHIGDAGCSVIAQHLFGNQTLETLNLSNNKLIGLSIERGAVCGALNLQPFDDLIQCVRSNKTLTSLDVSGNRLGGVYVRHHRQRPLPFHFITSPNASSSSSNSSSSSSKHNNLCEKVTSNNYVSLDECYGAAVLEIIIEFIQNASSSNVKYFNIANNAFDSQHNEIQMSRLIHALNGCKRHDIFLSLCSGDVAVMTSVFNRLTMEQRLVGAHTGNTIHHTNQLATSLSGVTNIESFGAGFTSAHSVLPKLVAPSAAIPAWERENECLYPYGPLQGPVLTVLERRFNGCGLDSFTGLLVGADRLQWRHIHTLDLSHNPHFGNAGLGNLVRALECNAHAKGSSVQRLHLTETGLTTSGISSVLCLMVLLPFVRELDLSENVLGFRGLYSLCNFLLSEFLVSRDGAEKRQLQVLALRSISMHRPSSTDAYVTKNDICCVDSAPTQNAAAASSSLSNSLTGASVANIESEEYEVKLKVGGGCTGSEVGTQRSPYKYCATPDVAANSLIALIGSCGLQVLDLSDNVLSGEFIKKIFTTDGSKCSPLVSTLKSFRMSNVQLRKDSTQDVVLALSDPNVKLMHLDISVNPLCGIRTEHSFDPIHILSLGIQLRATNRSLTALNLSNSDIGARSTKRLMEALFDNEQLHTLILDGCNCSEEGCTHIGNALPDINHLKYLSINNCFAGAIGGQMLFLGVAENKSLTYLDASNNYLTGYHDLAGLVNWNGDAIGAISITLTNNLTLKTLNISDNSLFGLTLNDRSRFYTFPMETQVEVIEQLADAVSANGLFGGQLEYLMLLHNRISVNCSDCASCGGKDNCSSECKVHLAVTRLVTSREKHPFLRSLLGITRNTTHLRLISSKICDHVCQLIASELRFSHTLRVIDLDNNNITERGARLLEHAIRENVSLQLVRLPSYKFRTDVSKRRRAKLARDPNYSAIDIIIGSIIQSGANQSLEYRVSLSLFACNGITLGSAVVRFILEYCIGDGPLLFRFLKCITRL